MKENLRFNTEIIKMLDKFCRVIYAVLQHSTAQHSTAQHSTAQHSTAQHSTAQHNTAQHKLISFFLIFLIHFILTKTVIPCEANKSYIFGNDSWVVDNIHLDDPDGVWMQTANGKEYFYSRTNQKYFYENQYFGFQEVLRRKGLFAYNEYGQKVEFSKENAGKIFSDLLNRGSLLYVYNDTHDIVPLFSFSFSTRSLGGFLLTDINGEPLYFPSVTYSKTVLAGSVKKVILYDEYGQKIRDESGEDFAMYYGETLDYGMEYDLLTFLSVENGTNKAYMLDPQKNKIYIYNRNGDQLYIEKNPYEYLFPGKYWPNAKPYDHDSLLINSDIRYLNVGDKIYFLTEAGAKIFVNPPSYSYYFRPVLYDTQSSPRYVVDLSESYYYDHTTRSFNYNGTQVPRYTIDKSGTLTLMTVRGENGWYDPNTWGFLYAANGQSAHIHKLPESGISPKAVNERANFTSAADRSRDITISIPRLGVDTGVFGVPGEYGMWDVSWLGYYGGWLQNSDFPGTFESSNSVITAHSYLYNGMPGPFAHLNELGYGDQIYIHAFGEDYIYTVIENKTTFEDDLSVLKKRDFPCLTLITCKGYDEASDKYLYRVVIHARLTEIN